MGVEGALAAGQCTGVRAAIGYMCLCNQVNSVCIATANTPVALSSGTGCLQSLDTNVPTCPVGCQYGPEQGDQKNEKNRPFFKK